MKIAVYHVEKFAPQSAEEEEVILERVDLPSLKSGYTEVIGKFSHWVTKSELRKMQAVSQRYYDRSYDFWRTGLLLTGFETKMFAQYAGEL